MNGQRALILDYEHHLEAFAARLVDHGYKARLRALLATPHGQRRFTSELNHFEELDPRWRTNLSDCDANAVITELQARRAPECGICISADAKLDGSIVDLGDAIRRVRYCGCGTLVSFVPGKLAYFENEYEAYLLERS